MIINYKGVVYKWEACLCSIKFRKYKGVNNESSIMLFRLLHKKKKIKKGGKNPP